MGHTGLLSGPISFALISLQLTSSIIATIALSLTIPLAIVADRIFGFHAADLTVKYYCGALMVLASFVLINLVTFYPEACYAKHADQLTECRKLKRSRIGCGLAAGGSSTSLFRSATNEISSITPSLTNFDGSWLRVCKGQSNQMQINR